MYLIKLQLFTFSPHMYVDRKGRGDELVSKCVTPNNKVQRNLNLEPGYS